MPYVPARSTDLTHSRLDGKIAHAAFRKGKVYMRMLEVPGAFFTNDQFIDLYPADGQPAYAPWRLELVSVMQFISRPCSTVQIAGISE